MVNEKLASQLTNQSNNGPCDTYCLYPCTLFDEEQTVSSSRRTLTFFVQEETHYRISVYSEVLISTLSSYTYLVQMMVYRPAVFDSRYARPWLVVSLVFHCSSTFRYPILDNLSRSVSRKSTMA